MSLDFILIWLVFLNFIQVGSSGSFMFMWVLHVSPSRNTIMRELAPVQIPWSIPMEAEDIPIVLPLPALCEQK